jgi:hypothetical protein
MVLRSYRHYNHKLRSSKFYSTGHWSQSCELILKKFTVGRQLTDSTLTDGTTYRLRQLTDRANWRQLTDYDNLPTAINLYINGQLTDYKLTDSYRDIRHFLPEASLACQEPPLFLYARSS